VVGIEPMGLNAISRTSIQPLCKHHLSNHLESALSGIQRLELPSSACRTNGMAMKHETTTFWSK
jgi:hypothetical protein